MMKIRTSRQFALALFSWAVAAIVGITVAFIAVGFFHLWVLVGAVGAIGATLVTGFILQVALCTDSDAMRAARSVDDAATDAPDEVDRAA